MRRWLLYVAMLVTLQHTAAGQTAAEKGHCLLWRISGNGLKTPSYLFATMDVVCPTDFFWPASVEKYYQSSRTVALQVNYNDAETIEKNNAAFLNTGGRTLKYYFSPEDYKKVEAYASQTMHIDLNKLEGYQPVAIRPLIIKQLLGCQSPVSYLVRISAMNKKNRKTTVGLETVEDQIAMVEAIKYNEKVVKVLVEMANGSKEFEHYRKRVEEAYQRQNLPAVRKLSGETVLFSPAELQILYDKPAKMMVDKMPELMKQGQVFFALSAVYFWGNTGIISLLRKEGYKVSPVVE